jgi:hypothetical protein
VGFFEGAMAGVVLSSNLFMSYFLLEMLTLSTYLLVGFWYAQPLVVTAARDAFLTKRVGDVLLLMAMVALSAWAGSMEFTDLYELGRRPATSPAWGATLLGLGLIAGPMGKCAQFPMHLWLDEAMEGPNPASILRNSAVVTCGALVLLKVMPLLRYSPLAIDVLLVVGTISALGGALVAIAQVDLKRPSPTPPPPPWAWCSSPSPCRNPPSPCCCSLPMAWPRRCCSWGWAGVIATTNCQDLTELGGLGSPHARHHPRLPGGWGRADRAGAPGLFLVLRAAGGSAGAPGSLAGLRGADHQFPHRPQSHPGLPGRVPGRSPPQDPAGARGELVDGPADGEPHGDGGLTPLAMARITSLAGITDSPRTCLAADAQQRRGLLAGGRIRLDRLWSRSSQMAPAGCAGSAGLRISTRSGFIATRSWPSWPGLARFTDSFDRTGGEWSGQQDRSGIDGRRRKSQAGGERPAAELRVHRAGGDRAAVHLPVLVLSDEGSPTMLSGLLLIPFLGALALMLWPGDPEPPKKVRRVCLALLGLQLLWTLRLLIPSIRIWPGLQLQESLPWVASLGLDYRLGIDGLSLPLVVINAASP